MPVEAARKDLGKAILERHKRVYIGRAVDVPEKVKEAFRLANVLLKIFKLNDLAGDDRDAIFGRLRSLYLKLIWFYSSKLIHFA